MSEHIETRLIRVGRDPASHFGTVNAPVTRASTILFDSLADARERRARSNEPDALVYGTLGTPVVMALERAVAELDGGYATVAVSSGLAAVTSAILAFVRAGDHVLVPDSVYEPTRTFCGGLLAAMNVETTFYDPLAGGEIAALIRPNTRVAYAESPGSLTFEVQDIPAIARAAHARGCIVIMDTTWATPLHFPAIAHGVDVVVHAGTKYIGGHSDLLLGLITATEATYAAVRRVTGQLGHCLAADDAYLALRGLRTMAIRLERQAQSALTIAHWLAEQPDVVRVLYPPLSGDPGHALWKRDFTGAAGLLGFVVRPVSHAAIAAFVDGLERFGIGYSWGGFESLITHAYRPPTRTLQPWPAEQGELLRLSVGLEHPDDLIADLAHGFERLRSFSIP